MSINKVLGNSNNNQNNCLYICGLCKQEVHIDSPNIVCQKCGYRILYKKRTDKCIEYLAR